MAKGETKSPLKATWQDRTLGGKILSVIAPVPALAYQGIDTKRQKLKDEIAASEEQRMAQQQAYEGFDFVNPYANLENPFEDLTINQQAADFMAKQQAQSQANTLAALRASAGGSGIAGLAQVLQQQNQANLQAAQADIAAQESNIQQMKAQGEMQLSKLAAAGEQQVQQQQFGRIENLLEMSMGREAGARQAASAFDQQLVNIGTSMLSTAGQVAGASIGNPAAFGGSISPSGINTGGLPTGYGGAQTQAGYDYFNNNN